MSNLEFFPLSPSQEDLYYDQVLVGDIPKYVLNGYTVAGLIERAEAQLAWDMLVSSLDSLRIKIVVSDGEPSQYVQEKEQVKVEVGYLDFSKETDPRGAFEAWVHTQSDVFISYESNSLFRPTLVKLADDDSALHVISHHILADGIGVYRLHEYFHTLIYQLRKGISTDWLHQIWPFKQVVSESINYLNTPKYLEDKSYFTNLLQSLDSQNLPIRFSSKEYTATRLKLPLAQVQQLKALCKAQKINMLAVVSTVTSMVMSKVLNQKSVALTTITHGRQGKEGMLVIGTHINLFPFAAQVDDELTLPEQVMKIGMSMKQSYKRSQFPNSHINRLANQLGCTVPDIVVTYDLYQNASDEQYLREACQIDSKYEAMPLLFRFRDFGSSETIKLIANFGLQHFSVAEVDIILARISAILSEVVSDPMRKVGDFNYFLPDEKSQLLEAFNQTDATYPLNTSISEQFEAQVKKTPDAIAVIFHSESITYAQLNARANQLAHALKEKYSARCGSALPKDTLVALYLDRGIEMIVSLLAVMKAGAAYVPISPDYPEERTCFILEDTHADFVLTQSRHHCALEKLCHTFDLNVENINVDHWVMFEALPTANLAPASADRLSYVIYTSGTTGKPKGVMIEQSVFAHFILSAQSWLPLNAYHTISLTQYTFDIFGLEYALPLVTGGSVVVSSFEALTTDLEKHCQRITFLQQTPSMWKVIHDSLSPKIDLSNVDMVVGGEAGSADLFEKLDQVVRSIRQVYGPTEACIWSTQSKYEPGGERCIGKPMPNEQAYVLDENMELLPSGAPGELYLAGAGLARGYWNRDDLTDAAFQSHEFVLDGKKIATRLYKTGDQVRMLPHAGLEYLNRNDGQVKIRGFRIELGEVENALLQEKNVKQAVVIDREHNGTKYLAAYLVLPELAIFDPELLVSNLSQHLPEFMLPSSFTLIDVIPLTINGKLDRRALPEPEWTDEGAYVAPRSALEKSLCEIWQNTLGQQRVGIEDNFFKLGGDSISAIKIKATIQKELGLDMPLDVLFAQKNIANLAAKLAQNNTIKIPALKRDIYPVSYAQSRMLFLSEFEPNNVAYHIPYLVKLQSDANLEYLISAIDDVCKRHPVMAASYRYDETGQAIAIPSKSSISVQKESFESQSQLLSAVKKSINTPFTLTQESAFRLCHYSTETEQYLLMVWHHVASDGWSVELFTQEVELHYLKLQGKEHQPLPELDISYGDYALWQQETLDGDIGEKQLQYWKNTLDNYENVELPITYQRPAQFDYRGADVSFEFSQAFSQQLKAFAQQQETTIYTVLLSAFYVALHKLSGQDDLVIGSPTNNREQSQVQSLIGFFANTLPLRAHVKQSATVCEFINHVHDIIAQAKSHQDIPFERLVEALGVERDSSRHPIFQVLFSLLRDEDLGGDIDGLPWQAITFDVEQPLYNPAKFDITAYIRDGKTQISGVLNFAEQIFDHASMQRLLDMYQLVLAGFIQNADQQILHIDVVPETEKYHLLNDFNATDTPFPENETLVSLFEAQAVRTPDATALLFEDAELSYAELNTRANHLAWRIRQRYEVEHSQEMPTDTVIALYLERSLEMVVSILAIMKAGGAYVPVSPELPAERVGFILQDTASPMVLTQEALLETLTSLTVSVPQSLIVDVVDSAERKASFATDAPELVIKPTQLAYVIYTSGTTGLPKGVALEHRAVVNRLHWMQKQYPLSAQDRVLQKTPYSFDVSVWELLWAHQVGATLVMASPGIHTQPDKLHDILNQQAITTLHFVPSMLNAFSQHLQENGQRMAPSTRQVFCSGEALGVNDVENFREVSHESCGLYNLYGPTEAAIDVTYFDTSAPFGASVPIGKAIDNIRLYVLNEGLSVVPLGSVGELYIGGVGLARGYLNRAELNAERFVDNPYANEADKAKGYNRLYRTGDVVRYLADGNIEYLGRNDDQVKIRGFRIELGEISAVLGQAADVQQAVVIDKSHEGSQYLAAYVVMAADVSLDEAALRTHLSAQLPEYMVPSRFIALERIPMTVNGKLDRRALPEPSFSSDMDYEAPRDALETELCGLWSQVLPVEQVGIHDNFFRSGGDSILSIQLVSKLRQAGHSLQVKAIFDAPTVAELAVLLTASQSAQAIDAEQGVLTGEFGLLPVQSWFMAQDFVASHHVNQAFMVQLPASVSTASLDEALERLVEQHDMLRVCVQQVGEQVTQVYSGVSLGAPLQALSVADMDDADLHQALTAAQSSFDLHNGPLWTALHLVDDSDGRSRLFFALHHWLVDAVSWRIIATDLQTLLSGGKLGDKTSSYRQWVAGMRAYGELIAAQEVPYWQQVMADYVPLTPLATTHTEQLSLTREHTERLLHQANEGFHTETSALLLSALTQALSETFDGSAHHVTLEGHGREAIGARLEVSQTVGWFTSMYPVRLAAQATLADTIMHTKDMLGALPNKGIGFGALQQAGALADARLPRLRWNYLGQLAADTDSEWSLNVQGCGDVMSSHNSDNHVLDINSAIQDGQLQLHCVSRLSATQSQQFMTALDKALTEVIALGEQQAQAGALRTVTDYFPEAATTQDLPSLATVLDLQSRYAVEALHPATSLQQGFIYHHVREPQDDAYRVQMLFDYRCALNVADYKAAWALAIQQFPSLRMAFDWSGSPLQILTHKTALSDNQWREEDISHLGSEAREAAIAAIQQADRQQGFDLASAALFRVTIIKQADDVYTVLKSEHHSISDGWSTPVMFAAVHGFYDALQRAESPTLTPDTAYSATQHYYQRTAQATKAYWATQAFPAANDFSAMLSHPVNIADIHAIERPLSEEWTVPAGIHQGLQQVSQRYGVTLNAMLQFAWHYLLHVYSGDACTVVGTTVSGRDLPIENIEHSVGLYINTLPLMVDWSDGEQTLVSVLQQVQQGIAQMNSHSAMSLASLQHEGARLFHSLFVFENYPMPAAPSAESLASHFVFQRAVEKVNYPLLMTGMEHESRLVMQLSYGEAWLTRADAQQLLARYTGLLQTLAEAPTQAVRQLSLVTASERDYLLHTLNPEVASYPTQATLHDLVAQRAADTPEAVALIGLHEHTSTTLTYAALDQQANQRAHYVRAQYAARTGNAMPADTLIGVYQPRGVSLLINVLAILRAGAGYVPLSMAYPDERIQFIVDDTDMPLLLTDSASEADIQQSLQGARNQPMVISDNTPTIATQPTTAPQVSVQATDIAYVIYTSGTTGKPKGVLTPHRGVVSLVQGNDYLNASADDVFVQLSDVGFDAATLEIWGALTHGARLVIPAPEMPLSAEAISAVLQQHHVSVLWLTRALFDSVYVQSPNMFAALRVLLVGGEALTAPLMRQLGQQSARPQHILNGYGPTESTTFTTTFACEAFAGDSVPIGRPINTRQLFILNQHQQLVPMGAPGELYIGGAGLATGYLNRPELNDTTFIAHPFATDADRAKGYTRLYRTGDLVRYLADGEVAYLGRNDTQVKIRGYRIELGEIESALLALPTLCQAAVIAVQRDNSKALAAYVVAEADSLVDMEALRHQLHSRLPEYMVPSTFMVLEALPLTVNGKLDRRQLPAPQWQQNDNYEAPRNNVETELCAVWSRLLGLEQVGIHDNFFRIGGDSIISIQLVTQLRQLGYQLQVKAIFDAPTVATLAELLAGEAANAGIEAEQGALTGEFALLPIQSWFFEQGFAAPQHWNQAFMVQLPAGITDTALNTALAALAAQHDMLRVRFSADGTQVYSEASTQGALQTCDVSDLDDNGLAHALTAYQGQFDLREGPLWQPVWLTGYAEGRSRLFLALHHLVIDAVSWRIIATDLQTLLTGGTLGEKTSSYRQWVTAVQDYAQRADQECHYWEKVMVDYAPLPTTEAAHTATEQWVRFDETVTQQLLQQANGGFNTDINDLLLSALTQALAAGFATSVNHITLEGHGREALSERLDISHTVGWFTSMYPVRLQAQANVADTIVHTKEMLRQLPLKGLGFSALRQAGRVGSTLPAISFNYLGQLNRDTHEDWQLVSGEVGQQVSAENGAHLTLNINGAVQDGCLQFHFASTLSDTETASIATAFETALRDIVVEALKQAELGGTKTASDYGTHQVSTDQLSHLKSKHQSKKKRSAKRKASASRTSKKTIIEI